MRISDWSSDVCSSDLIGTAKIETDIDLGPGIGVIVNQQGCRLGIAAPVIGEREMVEAEAHRCAREGFEEPVLIRRRGNFEGEFLHQTKMLHCDRPVAGTFPTRRSREPLPGSPAPVPLRHGRQMGPYATDARKSVV